MKHIPTSNERSPLCSLGRCGGKIWGRCLIRGGEEEERLFHAPRHLFTAISAFEIVLRLAEVKYEVEYEAVS